MTDNAQIALLFEELADIMELAGENYFKIRAYRNAAAAIKAMTKPLQSLSHENIGETPGIGKAISQKIRTAITTGTFPTLEKWRQSGYATLLPLIKIDRLDIRKLRGIIKASNISSIDDMKISIDSGSFDSYMKLDSETKERIKNFVSTRHA